MQLHKSTIAIWGYGTVGKAVVNYLKQKHNSTIVVYDTSISERYHEETTSIWFAPEQDIYTDTYDWIIPSPGINLNKHPQLQPYCFTEYDLFAQETRIPHIGISGSLGKTTATSLITNILHQVGISASFGGNIGIGMCDLLHDEHNRSYNVLELSSFQLEHTQHAAPDLAILTNFYPNHIDRHESVPAYLHAKGNLFIHQSNSQIALLPISLRNVLKAVAPHRSCYVFAPSPHEYALHCNDLYPDDVVYYARGNMVYKHAQQETQVISTVPNHTTFGINWLMVFATLDILGVTIPSHINELDTDHTEHRREYIGTYNGITWYNDSKATIMPATYTAIESLQPQPITLLLGGLSKCVDRKPYIAALYGMVQRIICFGKEADTIRDTCEQHNIPAYNCTTLEEAVTLAYQHTPENSYVVLSPGGSSFDQFNSYQERGRKFKEYIMKQTNRA